MRVLQHHEYPHLTAEVDGSEGTIIHKCRNCGTAEDASEIIQSANREAAIDAFTERHKDCAPTNRKGM